MSKNAIVVYKPKATSQQLANLAKARAARGKLSTKLKQQARAVASIKRSCTKMIVNSAPALNRIMATVPTLLHMFADGLVAVTKKYKKRKRK
jgi:hypothetical protein